MAPPKTADFKLNAALRDYLAEHNIQFLDYDSFREFSKACFIDTGTLRMTYSGKFNLGASIQARLYIYTQDDRFAPRNENEQKVLEDWKIKVQELKLKKIKAAEEANSLAEKDPYEYNDVVIELLVKYNIGKKEVMSQKDVYTYLQMAQTTFYNMLRKQLSLKGETKLKFFLGFLDERLAPINDKEEKKLEQLRKKIPNPLPFVTIPTEENNDKEINESVPNDDFTEKLLANERFLDRLAEKLLSRFGDQEIPTKNISSESFSPTEDDNLKELLEKLIFAFDRIFAMNDADNLAARNELETLAKNVEEKMGEVFLNVRAFTKTHSGSAALKILSGEKTFAQKFRPTNTKKGG